LFCRTRRVTSAFPEATPVVLPNAPRNFRFSGRYAGCSAERAA
jgi:hypothetical protein